MAAVKLLLLMMLVCGWMVTVDDDGYVLGRLVNKGVEEIVLLAAAADEQTQHLKRGRK